MNTFADAFSLCNSSAGPSRRSGFRVPFGLRDGRAWAPSEVARGKACGCVCPGCGAALVAKAQTSRRRRPHFAHLTDTGCQTGRERSEEHTSELQSLMRTSYAVFSLKKKTK